MKIFIVSSGRSKALAQRVCFHLTQQFKGVKGFDCDVWCSDTFQPGDYTLQRLVETCGSSDFAVILLTKDDQTNKKNTQVLAPRDNCIFELGLFLGGLMFQHTRCIILSSVAPCALPTDIDGITVIPFNEPPDTENAPLQELDEAVKNTVPVIANSVQAYGPLLRLEISPKTLLQMEKLDVYRGCLKPSSTVTVKAASPLEISDDVDFADQVQRNLEGFVKYRYFFQYVQWDLGAVASLVQVLAAAGIPGQHPLERKMKMRDCKDQVLKNLDNMRQRISIDLFPKMVPLEFCIHNATSPMYAGCYLRLANRKFLKYCDGSPAYEIATDLMRAYPKQPDERPIFTESLDNDLTPAVRTELCRLLCNLFDQSFHQEMKEVCFG